MTRIGDTGLATYVLGATYTSHPPPVVSNYPDHNAEHPQYMNSHVHMAEGRFLYHLLAHLLLPGCRLVIN